MYSKERNFLILNSLIIVILIAMRLMVLGWILFGFFVILPVIILHAISSTKGFMIYSKLIDKDKFILFLNLFLFAIFILFQYEMDDRAGYMIIEAFIGRISTDDNSSISFPVSIISGLMVIIADIYILSRVKKLNNK